MFAHPLPRIFVIPGYSFIAERKARGGVQQWKSLLDDVVDEGSDSKPPKYRDLKDQDVRVILRVTEGRSDFKVENFLASSTRSPILAQ